MPAFRSSAAILGIAVLITFIIRIQLSMEADGHSAWAAICKIFRFFTIWTNALIGVAMLWIAAGRQVSSSVLSCLMMAMVLVSGVYYGVLFVPGKNTGMDAVVDGMFHAVIPLATLIYWLVFTDKGVLRYVDAVTWQSYPLIYCIYALLRGAWDGIYPYRFLDPDQIGWILVGRNIALLAVAFVICGLALVALGRALGRRQAEHTA